MSLWRLCDWWVSSRNSNKSGFLWWNTSICKRLKLSCEYFLLTSGRLKLCTVNLQCLLQLLLSGTLITNLRPFWPNLNLDQSKATPCLSWCDDKQFNSNTDLWPSPSVSPGENETSTWSKTPGQNTEGHVSITCAQVQSESGGFRCTYCSCWSSAWTAASEWTAGLHSSLPAAGPAPSPCSLPFLPASQQRMCLGERVCVREKRKAVSRMDMCPLSSTLSSPSSSSPLPHLCLSSPSSASVAPLAPSVLALREQETRRVDGRLKTELQCQQGIRGMVVTNQKVRGHTYWPRTCTETQCLPVDNIA